MTTLQEQARALGDPTRHRIFRYVADADRAVDVPELTGHFGLNHNAVRQHLAKLVEAGLVAEGKARPAGPGRPRLTYELAPAADGRWGVTGPYETLSLWLAEVIRSGDSPYEVGRRVGREHASASAPSADPVALLTEEMARFGFEPTVTRRGRTVDVTLGSCPFVTTALADPGTVCDLHHGMARGIAECTEGLVVDDLVPKDPRRAHCRLSCRVEESAPAG